MQTGALSTRSSAATARPADVRASSSSPSKTSWRLWAERNSRADALPATSERSRRAESGSQFAPSSPDYLRRTNNAERQSDFRTQQPHRDLQGRRARLQDGSGGTEELRDQDEVPRV